MLREWRKRRNLSQLALALQADTSSRHLSFVETGRAVPSRELVLRLADQLDVPMRQRNSLLMAAGYAPAYEETPISEAQMDRANEAIDRLLAGHDPYPALVLDSDSNLRRANRSAMALLDGVCEELLRPPVNIMRLALHPEGLAPRILNFAEWRVHLLGRLRRDAAFTNNECLTSLYDEVSGYRYPQGTAVPEGGADSEHQDGQQIAIPLRIRALGNELSFFSALTVFAAPADITLAELTIETFYPADAQTATVLHSHYQTVNWDEPAPGELVALWAAP
ncbi:helix-turn-helix domain-containing protein [Streptomyces sp. NPDC000658]|uniref:helix-turn-helix domain-containing protein n=1 Tax=Streptomyces sp. NPDC000658 TaxID=3154266 RepID=UPI0033239C5A